MPNKDEIIEMAIQAHVDSKTWIDIYKDSTTAGEARQYLEAFAKLVADVATAKEREACAQLCDNPTMFGSEGEWCAAAIRDRGQET